MFGLGADEIPSKFEIDVDFFFLELFYKYLFSLILYSCLSLRFI